ncbi:MAG: hypothetical protein LBN99_04190 [Oscillospiraceae bacterium]|jgi:hypothetical protein|nr:hypothetical protein [Oscillospiraceae bacterium]
MVETYVKQSDALAMFPERYPWLDIDGVPPKKYRKMMFSGNYLALYVVDNENMRVYVDAVVDCRADYGFLL